MAEPPGTPGIARSEPARPASERRLVTVLFADLVGFTTLSEDRDPEAVRELLTRYFDTAREIVARYGGEVEKFIGDAVMAVWGTPTAHEDDAERAVRAGLDLVDAVRALGADQRVPGLEVRAGILTGEAAVTLGAEGQGMVAGDLVNTASRLQSVAPSGTVLVGESTQRAAAGAVVFEPAGDQLLKGRSAPVPAFRAVRVVAKRGGVGRAEGVEAPFVGRDEELRLLKDLFHRTARERKARLVSVTGQAGIGKSRLAWEFSKYTDGVLETVYWHQGRSPAFGDGLTFWALGEMVRRRVGLLETDDDRTTRTRVAERLDALMPAAPERDAVERALLALLGLEQPPAGGRDALFAAWRSFFEHVALQGPTVLLFEDLQWADAGVLDFIDHLLEWSRDHPIYIVTLARPELLERRPDWGAGRRNFLALSLEPLPESAMRELLSGLIVDLPESATRAILGRAGGVPLYAVETVRMLVSEGRLRAVDGRYEATGDLTTLAVPETLHALIASRLDALEAADRTLVQDASVLGLTFTLDSLAAVSGVPVGTMEGNVRRLVRAEMLAYDSDPLSPERGQYGFTQALIREVAYGTLARQERRRRHLAAARHFEALGDEELAGVLASHYVDAYRASPDAPEAEPVRVQARLALRGAAERAARLGSNEHAVDHLRQALSIATPAERTDLLERLGHVATAAGRYRDADAALREAIEARRAEGDRSATARAIAGLGRSMLDSRRVEEAVRLLEPALAEFHDMESDPSVVELMAQLARAHMFTNRFEETLDVADRALVEAERLALLPVIADTMITKGMALSNAGRVREGVALTEAGRRMAEARGLTGTEQRALVNLTGMLYVIDPGEAFRTAKAGVEILRKRGQRGSLVSLVGNATELAMTVGDWDWPGAPLAEMLDMDLEPVDRSALLGIAIELRAVQGEPTDDMVRELDAMIAADPSLEFGRLAQALAATFVADAAGRLGDAYETGLRIADTDPLNGPFALLIAGRAAVRMGDADRARVALRRLEATGVRGPAIDTPRAAIQAGVAALSGDRAVALEGFRATVSDLRALGMTFDAGLACLLAVAALGPDDTEAAAFASDARQTFERLGARPYLAQLDALESGGAGPATSGRSGSRSRADRAGDAVPEATA